MADREKYAHVVGVVHAVEVQAGALAESLRALTEMDDKNLQGYCVSLKSKMEAAERYAKIIQEYVKLTSKSLYIYCKETGEVYKAGASQRMKIATEFVEKNEGIR